MFSCPDGKTFDNRKDWKKYMFETFYQFSGKSKETLVKNPGDIEGQPFNLENLTDCEVRLMDHSEQIQVDDVNRCKVMIGPSCESVFIRNCSDCVFTVACKQLRTRDCHRCTFFLYCKTDPVIETSSWLKFAPFNGAYPGLTSQFASANLNPAENKWLNIFDFNKDDDSIPQPHWLLLERAGWTEWAVPVDGNEQCERPVDVDLSVLPEECQEAPPPTAGAVLAHGEAETNADGSVMQSFSIHTTQAEAQVLADKEIAQHTSASTAGPATSLPKDSTISRVDPVVRNGRVRMHNAVLHGGIVYLTAQVAEPDSTDIAVQTVQILEKIDRLLGACSSSKSHILQATVWLADMRYYTQMNAVWDSWVDQDNAPARACVEARLAATHALVEIQVTAAQI